MLFLHTFFTRNDWTIAMIFEMMINLGTISKASLYKSSKALLCPYKVFCFTAFYVVINQFDMNAVVLVLVMYWTKIFICESRILCKDIMAFYKDKMKDMVGL